MASYVNATTKKMLPITYKCVECGKQNVDISVITATGSARVKLIKDNSREAATQYAKDRLIDNQRKLEKEMSNRRFGKLTCEGKCSECGTVQPWVGSKIKNFIEKNTLKIWIGLFILLCALIIVLEKKLEIYTILGAAVFTFFFGSFIIMGLNGIASIISVIVSNNGTSNIIKNGKEDCLPIIYSKENEGKVIS